MLQSRIFNSQGFNQEKIIRQYWPGTLPLQCAAFCSSKCWFVILFRVRWKDHNSNVVNEWVEAFYPLIHIEDPWFPKWLLNCEGLIFWHDWYVSQIFQPWLYTDFWLVSALQRQINEIRWNLPSQSSKETKRIVSLWVKAIKRWPWLMRRFESLMKSSIEPNTPTRRDPLPFLLISYQLLDQHNITVNLLTLCPFPEPTSRVLELYAHSFFPPHLSPKRWRAARTRFLRSHPMRIIPLAPTWRKLKKKQIWHYLWIREPLHPDSCAF